MQPTVILDVDDVVVDLVRPWLLDIERDYGVKTLPEQITRWDMHLCTPELETLGPAKIYGYFDKPGFHLSKPPVEGAINAVKHLDKISKLVFVTARHGPLAIMETFDWFKEYLPRIQHKQIVFSRDKSLFQADVAVDDKDSHLEAYLNAPHLQHAIVIGVERPHNAEYQKQPGSASLWVPANAQGWTRIVEAVETAAVLKATWE